MTYITPYNTNFKIKTSFKFFIKRKFYVAKLTLSVYT